MDGITSIIVMFHLVGASFKIQFIHPFYSMVIKVEMTSKYVDLEVLSFKVAYYNADSLNASTEN